MKRKLIGIYFLCLAISSVFLTPMTKTFIGENGLRAYGDTVYTTFFTFDFLPDGRWQYRIDFSRLIIIWIAITLAFTAVYFLLPVKKKSDPRG